MIGLLLIALLVVLLVGAVPRWRWSTEWGATPAAVVGIVLLIFLIYYFGFLPAPHRW